MAWKGRRLSEILDSIAVLKELEDSKKNLATGCAETDPLRDRDLLRAPKTRPRRTWQALRGTAMLAAATTSKCFEWTKSSFDGADTAQADSCRQGGPRSYGVLGGSSQEADNRQATSTTSEGSEGQTHGAGQAVGGQSGRANASDRRSSVAD
eukprot:2005029-Amphidinium_carterae.1